MDNFGVDRPRRGAGGTPGGLLEFFVGLLLIVAGGCLFINQVTVISRGFRLFFP